MAYQSMTFYDLPVEETPLNAENLNNMIEGIDEAHNDLSKKVRTVNTLVPVEFTTENFPSMQTLASLVLEIFEEKVVFIYRENSGAGYVYNFSVFDGNYSVLNQALVDSYITAETLTKRLIAVHIGSQVVAVSPKCFWKANYLEDVYVHNSPEKIGIANDAFLNADEVKIHYLQISADLKNSFESKLDNADGSVKENNIENGAVTGAKLSSTLYAKIFSDSLGYTSLGGEANPEANPFDTNITPSRLCTCVYNDTRYIFISTWWLFSNEQPAPAQYRFSENGIEFRVYDYTDKKWGDWEFVGKDAQIADGSVTTAKLADKSVTWAKIADSSISSAKLGDGAVTNSRIANGAVTEEKLSAELRDTIDTLNAADYMQYFNAGELTDKTDLNVPNFADVTAIWQLTIGGDLAAAIKGEESTFTAQLSYIAPYQILTDVETQRIYVRRVTRIAPNFSAEAWEERTPDFIVNSDKIADYAITTAKLADKSVTWAKLADNSITSAKIGTGAVTVSKIASGAITEEKLSDELKDIITTIEEDNLSGRCELSANRLTVAGKIDITPGVRTATFVLPQNIDVWLSSVVGKGHNGQHYIIDVNQAGPTIILSVRNMDGTDPAEATSVNFAVTTLFDKITKTTALPEVESEVEE